MVRLALIFGLIVTSTIAHGQHAPVPAIEQFVGKELHKLAPADRELFMTLFRDATGDKDALSKGNQDFVSDQLRILRDPSSSLIFIEILVGFSQPGFCGLRVHSFDDKWKRVSVDEFNTGYRQRVREVRQVTVPQVKQELIAVKCTYRVPKLMVLVEGVDVTPPPAPKNDFQLQFYAMIARKLMLVRLEDAQGGLIRNNYETWTIPAIGENFPAGTDDVTLELLKSGTDVERLAILVWLTGTHSPSSEPRAEGRAQEPVEAAKRYERIRSDSRLPAIIKEFSESHNTWVKEYALQFK
jgi:hypothetical protein